MKLKKIFGILLLGFSLFVAVLCWIVLSAPQQSPELGPAVLPQAETQQVETPTVKPVSKPRVHRIHHKSFAIVLRPVELEEAEPLAATLQAEPIASYDTIAATEPDADTTQSADLQTADPAADASVVTPASSETPTSALVLTPALSLPKGWVNITVHANELSQAIVVGMFPTVFLDNLGDNGKWNKRKDTGVKVAKSDDGTVTITTRFPEVVTATSAIAFVAYDKNGKTVGKQFLTGDLLLKKVQLDEVRSIPAPDFAKFDFGDRKIAAANKQLLHVTFEKQPSQVVSHLIDGGKAAGLTAYAVFNPLMWISAGPQDFSFVRSLVPNHAHAVPQTESDDLQATNQARAPDTTIQQ